ncbi:MAG: transporter substrate-binding domain-containing protein [Burkholderiaceae bacterium]|nr:transporter substrate-binding domain-containing protein [Burkholderiaceae bacterium]
MIKLWQRIGVMTAATLALGVGSVHASLLDKVKERGVLHCGTDNAAPGFGYLNTQTGEMEGLEVDLCRSVAAAVLGDAKKVKFVVVTDKSRFSAVQTNQVDVVFARTTLKPGRESAITVDFLPIYFYDGTGLMVKDNVVSSVKELDGATLCTTQGSNTEQTLAAHIKAQGWGSDTKVLTYENLERLFSALESGRCVAISTDRSVLASLKANAASPQDYSLLPEILNKSPFAGFTVANDSRWRNALRWIIYASYQAEEYGFTSNTIDTAAQSPDPFVQKFVGANGSFGPDFGLPEDFVARMIRQVGNFGEIYERNLGEASGSFIERKGTFNEIWTKGGGLYSPPWS